LETTGLKTINMRSPCSYFIWLALLLLLPALLWAQAAPPTDGDSSLASSSPCQISGVLPQVTLHVREFVENVNRFTAREVLERERLNNHGKVEEQAHGRSNYVAAIQEVKPGVFEVLEYRRETQELRNFDGTIEANVAPALALIFHPSHVEEFSMTCEGPADWHGHSTWQIHFQQRMDRPATMSEFDIGNSYFPILLKGSAWIDCDSYQILHLETNLLQPIPEVRLDMLHQSVDYGPVSFPQRDTTLWLPSVAEVTAQFRGRRLLERHIYSEFQLFSIDTRQKIGKPSDSSD
jgi:hypothetical protein